MNEFTNDGKGLFTWLKEYGKLEYDDTTRRELLNEWEESNMAKVGIRFTPNAIWEWLEYVETLGDKLGRSLSQRRKKILTGFPESFDVVTSPERLKPDPGSYVIPTHYPDYHPKHGQANPDAGKPDLYAMCKAFFPEWNHRIKSGQIKAIPRGSVYKLDHSHTESATEFDDDEESENEILYAPTARKQITSRSVCGVCGGRGHFGKVEGMECLTKQLGITIPRSELAQTKYPSGITYPFSSDPHSSSTSQGKSSHSAHLASSTRRPGKQRTGKNASKYSKPPSRTKPKRVSHVDDHDDSDHVEHEEYTEQEDDKLSDGDPQVDFTTFAIDYHTIDIRHNTNTSYSNDSSDDSSPHPCQRK